MIPGIMVLSLILAFIGLLAIYLEFWVPGSVMALIGTALLGGSLMVGFNFDWRFGAVMAQFELVAVILVVRLAIKVLSKSRMCLVTSQENYKGCSFEVKCIGKEGEVVKDLKPSGLIEIEGEHYQALSEGDYLRKGTKVTVVGGEGFHLIVR